MTSYWCANFDSVDCLKHGIKKKLWLMQYQYKDDHDHIYQDGKRKGRVCINWKQLKKISPGDWLVAYLGGKAAGKRTKESTFYAIGQVIKPRTPKATHDHTDTIENYLERQSSHDHDTGYVSYTAVFYEDFTDPWRLPGNELNRYPQRIDVDEWWYCIPDGVAMKGLNEVVKTNELIKAVFIPKFRGHPNSGDPKFQIPGTQYEY